MARDSILLPAQMGVGMESLATLGLYSWRIPMLTILESMLFGLPPDSKPDRPSQLEYIPKPSLNRQDDPEQGAFLFRAAERNLPIQVYFPQQFYTVGPQATPGTFRGERTLENL